MVIMILTGNVYALEAEINPGGSVEALTCKLERKVYSSCNSGYYLLKKAVLDATCTLCPAQGGSGGGVIVMGTSDTGNTNGITDCYLKPGKIYSDDSGIFEVADKCHFVEDS